MNKKKKNVKVVVAFLCLFIILFGLATFVVVLEKKKIDEYESLVQELQTTAKNNKQFVYVAKDNLTAGTVIEDGVNVEVQENVTALPSVMYIQPDDMGKVLRVDVDAYMPIMANMVTSESFEKDTRSVEIGVANLMLDQMVNDYVDIRVTFPDGSNYVVIPKLKIKTLSMENNIFYANMSEDEIITLESATIDAFTITGTKIYLTKYVESTLQDAATPNYPVRQETLALMASDPNILKRAQETLNAQARADLEARLALLSEDQLNAVNEGQGLIDTAHNKALVNLQKNSVSAFEASSTEETTQGQE